MKRIINERPLVFAVFFFVVGIAVSYYCKLSAIASAICLSVPAVIFLIFFLRGQVKIIFLYAAMLFLGALLFGIQYNTDFSGIKQGVEYDIQGRVADRQLSDYNRYTLADVTLDDGQQTIGFSQRVYLYSKERLEYGDIVRFQSEVDSPQPARNPKTMDEKMYLSAANVGFACFGHEVTVEGNRPGLYGGLLFLREQLSAQFDYYFTQDTALIAKAMFLGVRTDLPDEIRADFTQAGVVHVLVISGLHIAVISAAFLWLLKKLKAPRNARFLTVIAVLLFYMMLTGLAPPVTRMVIMTIFVIIGRWRFKDRDTLTFLAAAMLLTLLIFSTPQFFLPGFLMSYAIVFGLLCLTPAIDRLFKRIHFENWFAQLLAVSCAACIVAFPLTAYYFGNVSLSSPIANLFAVPLSGLIVVTSALFALFCWIPPVAAVLAFVPQVASELLLDSVGFLAKTGFGYITLDNFPLWVCAAVFSAVFLCSDYVFLRKRWKVLVASAVAGAIVLVLCMPVWTGNPVLKITVLDVGTGDAVHIRTQRGEYLVDNGGSLQRSQLEDYTVNNHIVYDAVFVTNEKTNNLEKLAESGYIRELYVPENYEPKGWEEKIPVKGYTLYDRIDMGGGAILEVAATDGKYVSTVVWLDHRQVCLLAQNEAVELDNMTDIPFVKIAKGGAEGSVSQEMLDALNPEAAVISVKGFNKKALPDTQVLEELRESGTTVYQTAQSGAVIIEWDKDGSYSIKKMI